MEAVMGRAGQGRDPVTEASSGMGRASGGPAVLAQGAREAGEVVGGIWVAWSQVAVAWWFCRSSPFTIGDASPRRGRKWTSDTASQAGFQTAGSQRVKSGKQTNRIPNGGLG